MADENFTSNWIDGFPVITRQASTRGFDFWLNDFPVIDEIAPDPVTSTAGITLANLTLTGAGTVINPVTGTAAITFGSLTVVSSGEWSNAGSANITLADLTVDSDGDVLNPVTGSASFTLDDLTVDSDGSVGVSGEGAFTLDDLTVVGAGDFLEATVGTADITLDDLALLSDGQLVDDRTGVGARTLSALTVQGAGEVIAPVTGTADILLGALALSSGTGNTDNPDSTRDYTDIPAPLLAHRRRFLDRATVTTMDSTRQRKRRQHASALPLLEVQWGFTREQFETFIDWYEDTLVNGEKAFFLSTFEVLDDHHYIRQVDWVLAFMAPYSWSGSDNSFLVNATLEVLIKSIAPESIVNPTNPPPERDTLPELKHDFDDFPCQEMFHLKMDGLEPKASYAVQISDETSGGKNGTYRDHVFFLSEATGEIDFVFNNDYGGNTWFRLYRVSLKKPASKPTNPPASFVKAPQLEITNLVASPHGLWSDMAYNNETPSNKFLNPYPYYIVPRYRKMSSSGPSLDPDPEPRKLTITGDAGTVTTWSRFNEEPEISTPIPELDGGEGNIAPQRYDFGYCIRARSFVPDGCKSPFTLYLVDKAQWIRPYAVAVGEFGDLSGTCDFSYHANVRLDWTRNASGGFVSPLQDHEYKSGQDCKTRFGEAGMRKTFIQDTRGGAGALDDEYIFRRLTTEYTIYGKSFLGSGDGGDHYIGWDQDFVATGTFAATGVGLTRTVQWDYFPKCFTNSLFAVYGGDLDDTQTGEYLVNPHSGDAEVLTGPGGSAGPTANTWQKKVKDAVKTPLAGVGDGSYRYNVWIVMTIHNDDKAPEAFDDRPPVVSPPTPHPPPATSNEDWEIYSTIPDTEAFPVTSFNTGHGWATTGDKWWHIKSLPNNFGEDTFEDYTTPSLDAHGNQYLAIPAFPLDQHLTKGSGWSAAAEFNGDHFTFGWIIKDNAALTVFEPFENYDLQNVEGGLIPIHTGAFGMDPGWADFWTVKPGKISGADSWELYSTGVIANNGNDLNSEEGWDIWWYITDSIHQMYGQNFENNNVGTIGGLLTGGTGWADFGMIVEDV